jgi:hypothetical protein
MTRTVEPAMTWRDEIAGHARNDAVCDSRNDADWVKSKLMVATVVMILMPLVVPQCIHFHV